MPIIQNIRNRVSRGRSANITSVFNIRNWNPSLEPQPTFALDFENDIKSKMNSRSIVHSCFVFPDEDIRTSQYVGSCGSAAITVALRHLHPQRIGQTGELLQPIADFDFMFEKKKPHTSILSLPAVIGHEFDQPYYRGRPGYVLWNQMTYYALTNNQIGSFMQLFNHHKNATNFRLYLHTHPAIEHLEFKESRIKKHYAKQRYFRTLESNNEEDIEDRLCEILERNHLPVVLVDGLIWSHKDHYTFPIDEDEWIKRASDEHERPADCTVIDDHPLLAELKDLIDNCEKEDLQENRNRPHDNELCWELKHFYDRLKHRLGRTTIGHAVVITGFYVRSVGGEVLWRVNDSNPPTKLDKSTTQEKSAKGSVNFMTTKELVSRMKGEGRSPMILEITSNSRCVTGNYPDERNLIAPVSLDNRRIPPF